MARIRSIKPDFFTDEDVAALPPLVRLVFVGLWTQADRAGRLADRPTRLKVQIVPYDNVDMDNALDQLVRARFIHRYETENIRYIQIRTWEKHQRPHHTEPPSVIPPNGCDTVNEPLPHREAPDGREGKGMEGKGTEAVPAAAPSARLHGSHKAHALCGQVCLPGFLFTEFVRLRGGDEQGARDYVERWWLELDDELKKGHPPIGNEVTYLRQRWEADHPVAKPKSKTVTFDVAAWCQKGA